MDPRARLRDSRDVICSSWLEQTLQTYPPEAAAFFRREQDRFANPVGATLGAGLEKLVRLVLAEEQMDATEACAALESVLQVRAVQSFTPARAVGFVFLLKDILGERAGAGARLEEVFRRVDQLALFAFDIYEKMRERIFELRVEEIKRSVSTLIKHADAFVSFPQGAADNESG